MMSFPPLKNEDEGTDTNIKVKEVPEAITFPDMKAEPDENCINLWSGELGSHGGMCVTSSEVGNEVIQRHMH